MCAEEILAHHETFVALNFPMDLKALLKAAGAKQMDVAQKLGVSEPTMSRWVKNGIPAERVPDMARVTGIPAAKLRPDLAQAFGGQAA